MAKWFLVNPCEHQEGTRDPGFIAEVSALGRDAAAHSQSAALAYALNSYLLNLCKRSSLLNHSLAPLPLPGEPGSVLSLGRRATCGQAPLPRSDNARLYLHPCQPPGCISCPGLDAPIAQSWLAL